MKIVLNDESIANDYGFKISNKGIDLSRFQNNNVLLMKHKSGDLAIGNVEDLKIEDSQLVGNVKFDKEDTDEEVVRLISKYERGVMKGFSMGVMINEFKTQMTAESKTEEIATASELYEVSCETLQSNKNSVTVKLMNNTEGLFKLGFNDKEKKFLNQNKNDNMDLTKLASCWA